MKFQVEVKLTASKALVAILSAFVGLLASKQGLSLEDEIPVEGTPVSDPAKAPVEIPAEQFASQGPVEPAAEKKRIRNTTKKQEVPIEKPVEQPVETATEDSGKIPAATVEEVGADQANEEPELTVDDIRNFAGQLLQKNPGLRDKVMAVLTKYGANKFSEAQPKDFKSIMAEFKTLA